IAKDSSFPFSIKEDVNIEIIDDKLVISKRDELFDIIENYGIKNATLPRLLQTKAIENKNKPFLFYKDESFSYKELNENSNRIAHGLLNIIKSQNLRRPKISVMLPNCPDFIFCWFGIVKTGGVFVSINLHYKGELLEYILKNSDTEILIIDYDYFEKYNKISSKLPKIKKIIIKNAPSDFEFNEKYMDFKEIYSSNIRNPKITIKHWYPMEINYTAGTTGKPKGVLYRNHFVLTGINIGKELVDIGLNQTHIIYCPLPLYHGSAQYWGILPALFYNASIVIVEKFDPSTFWEDVKKYNPAGLLYFRIHLSNLLNQKPNEIDRNHSIKWALGSGASKELWEKFENRFGILIYELWTLTEAIGITINKEGSKGGKIGSIGKSVSGYELKIVDSKGNSLPSGPENVGEIISRCRLPITWDYYNLSVKTLTKEGIHKWIHTGDYGYKDNDGFVYYVGNKADIINKNGEIIFTNKIENLVNSHPDILESAAFGVPNEERGDEDIKICVVLKDKSTLSFENLYDYLIQNMASFMVPRYIEFKRQLPKSSNSSIQKFVLKKEWERNNIKKNTWDAQIKDIIQKNINKKLEVID
ncbi:MAG: AMP-binding protein, partial [Promethearchaeota archaeon]